MYSTNYISERGKEIIVALVGNKTDLEEMRQVSKAEGEAKAREVRIIKGNMSVF